MAFDQNTRNRLARFVADARALLTVEFTRQLQQEYGMDPATGDVTDLARLSHLDDSRRATARILRETLHHYLAGNPKPDVKARRETLERIVREQAFTVLNRMAALRMAEARGLLLESIANGYQARGFQLYARVAGPALGETGAAYRAYLFSLWDEFAVDLPVLFDRFNPQGRLFPRESALLELLALINDADLQSLWGEDETIGWIYQYFNSQEERRQMRAESQAPRNSRELAVRNQFFTPRYVVEFLTDNTLGRIWYEMTQGATKLAETCRYLVRRPHEIFLFDPDSFLPDEVRAWVRQVRTGDFSDLPDDPTEDELASISFAFDGFAVAKAVGDYGDLMRWAVARVETFEQTGELPQSMLDRWLLLFAMQRSWRHLRGSGPVSPDFVDLWRRLYLGWREAIRGDHTDLTQEELLRQPVFIPHRPLKDPRTIRMLDPACGSMHFGLYAFDLYAVIYEEAWRRRLIAPKDFGYRAQAVFLHESVWLDPKRKPISTYSSKVVPFDQAYVAITRQGDGGDGIRPDWPELVDAHTRWRVPMDYRVPLRDFDYRAALRDGRFSPEAGEAFVRRAGCFAFEEIPAISEDLAYANYVRQIPRLIIEHNIHGIDIDPRAVQIAGLSLWLRAQRSWQQQGVKPADRPAITKSNVVCAEPMPGDSQMLAEFAAGLQPRVLGELVKVIFEKMKLAGEAGSLLKIEEEIAQAVETARKDAPLLDLAELPAPEQFWAEAEERLIDALREYAEQAQGDGLARRLFAADAARGFAFIDVCRKRYDVALMNPPFGRIVNNSRSYLIANYDGYWTDYYNMFPVRMLGIVVQFGFIGAIIPDRVLDTKKSSGLRVDLIDRFTLNTLVELGGGVMDDAAVRAIMLTSQVFRPNPDEPIAALDISHIESQDRAVQFSSWGSLKPIFLYRSRIRRIPGYCINLLLPDAIANVWKRTYSLDPDYGAVVKGGATWDDFRFLRCWWEVRPSSLYVDWLSVDTGGDYQLFYCTFPFVENWRNDGKEICANAQQYHSTDAQVRQSSRYWFRPAISFPYTSSIGFGPRLFPRNTILSSDTVGVFLNNDDLIKPVLGILASSWTIDVLSSFGTGRKTEAMSVKRLPLTLQDVDINVLKDIVGRCISHTMKLESGREVSQLFAGPVSGSDMALMFNAITENLSQIDEFARSAYGIGAGASPKSQIGSTVAQYIDPYDADTTLKAQLSLIIGKIFGRWDARNTTDKLSLIPVFDPLAPLPVCPPGMLQNAAGLPATPADVPADYPLRISWPGILVDDATNKEDIVGRVREALGVIWPETHDAIEQEACQILGVATLRDYFASPNRFFDDHLKRYSKSRRQAPIYWPLSTPSGSYTLWLYYHRLTDQTLYSCVNDFVEPKLAECGRQMADLRRLGQRAAAQERELEKLVNLTRELEEFRAELLRLAPLWKPNLNDGVQITAAPLWRLFQHRAWQKRLRETWEKLEAGDYDWAHLAYSLWPARVREKCRADKSLAIAHGLEELYVEPPAGKKAKGRKKADAEQEEMFDE